MDNIDFMNIISLIIGILSLLYAFYSTYIFSKGIKSSTISSIRTLINRIEEQKCKLDSNTQEWATLHHTQQNLEDVLKNLSKIFCIKEN